MYGGVRLIGQVRQVRIVRLVRLVGLVGLVRKLDRSRNLEIDRQL